MSESSEKDADLLHRLALAVIGIAIALGVVTGSAFIWSRHTGLGMEDGFDLLSETLITAVPFVILAALGVTRLFPWLVGLVLTLGLWGFAVYDLVVHWGTGRGANIGMGLIFIISPVVISGACLLATWKAETLGRKQR